MRSEVDAATLLDDLHFAAFTRMKKSSPSRSSKKKLLLKDPEGGLTAAGREAFRRSEGAHLKPGVKGKTDTFGTVRTRLGRASPENDGSGQETSTERSSASREISTYKESYEKIIRALLIREL